MMMTNMTEFAASTGVVSKSPQFLSNKATFTAACFDLCERHMLFFLKSNLGPSQFPLMGSDLTKRYSSYSDQT